MDERSLANAGKEEEAREEEEASMATWDQRRVVKEISTS